MNIVPNKNLSIKLIFTFIAINGTALNVLGQTADVSSKSNQTKTEPFTVKITYPREGSKIPAVKSSFVFGTVSDPKSMVLINGTTIPVYRTGSYLAMIPFSSGEFKIKVQAKSDDEAAETVRTVFVSSPPTPLPAEPLTIVEDSIFPSTNTIILPSDKLFIRFKGTPNCKAEYRFKNIKGQDKKNEWKQMSEKNYPVSGTYETAVSFESDNRAVNAQIELRLTNQIGKTIKVLSPTNIKILDQYDYSFWEVNADEAILRTGPPIAGDQMGYDLFLTKGTKLKSNGQAGSEIRVKLSESLNSWVEEKSLKKFTGNILPSQVIVDNVKIQSKGRNKIFLLDLKEKVPYRAAISNSLKQFTLTLFYAVSNLDRIRYEEESANKWLNQIRWFQTTSDTVDLQFELKEKIWGYDIHYEGNKLVCEFVFPPEIKENKLPLKDLTIAVDPGHSLEMNEGAVSPKGILEGEVVFQIATCLKEKLEKAGAKVFITRERKENISLPERGKRAWQSKADLFVSVHANALPDGANPLERRGYSIFYFQPQSFELAKSVHNSYKKMVKVTDDGLYYGNLAVCRVTQMPSILTESEYLIHPEGEELLLSKEYQSLVSEAIVNGIIQFFQPSDKR